MDDQLKDHILVPLPSLKDQPRPGSQSNEERLKAIISNLDQHHDKVRHNIVTAAIMRKEVAATNQASVTSDIPLRTQYNGNNRDEDMMDISRASPTLASPSPETSTIYANDATYTLLANLKVPHDPTSGDPCLKPGESIPTPDGTQQKESSPDMRLAKETVEQIRAYDEHAKHGKEYFVRALERRKSSNAGVPPTPVSAVGDMHPDRAAWLSGRTVQSPREVQGNGDPRLAGATDPRLRR